MVSAAAQLPEKNNEHRELIAYTYDGCMTEETQPNQYGRKIYPIQSQYGYMAMAYRAEDMKMRPKYARSLESIYYKIEKEYFRYARLNLSYTSKSFKKKNTRWMVGFFFDFDKEQLLKLGISSWEQLVIHVESKGFPVYAVIQTSSGFHVWCPMKALRGEWNGENTIRRYDAVMKAMSKIIGSDPRAASAEHYFRLPNAENLMYFRPIEKEDFTYYEKLVEPFLSVPEVKPATVPAPALSGFYMGQRGIKAILEGKIKTGTVGGKLVGRNNAALTLAIAMKKDGFSIERTREELEKWYSRINQNEFDFKEVEKCIQNAYINDYGVSGFYVEALSGYKLHQLTKRKERGKRQHHFSEIEQDVITYLKTYFFENGEHLTGVSNEKLAALISKNTPKPVSKSSLEKVIRGLKEKGKLDVQKIRQGRSFVSKYVLDYSLLVAEKQPAAAPKAEVVKIEELRKKSHRQPVDLIIFANGAGLKKEYDPAILKPTNFLKRDDEVGLFGMENLADSDDLFPVGGVKNPYVSSISSVGGVNDDDLSLFFEEWISGTLQGKMESAAADEFFGDTILDDDSWDE